MLFLNVVFIYLFLISQEKVRTEFLGCMLNFTVLPKNNILTLNECYNQAYTSSSTFYALSNMNCYHGDSISISLSNSYCNECIQDSNQCNITKYSVYSVCPIGYFGPYCLQRCHCKNRIGCFNKNGTCLNSCNLQWTLSSCSQIDIQKVLKGNLEDRYLGCYYDGEILNREWNFSNGWYSKTLNLAQCIEFCSDKFLPYAATQNTQHCSCLTSYGAFGKVSNSKCQCKFNDTLNCVGEGFYNGIFLSGCPYGTYSDRCKLDCNSKFCNTCNLSEICPNKECNSGWMGSNCSYRDCSIKNGDCGENESCVNDSYSKYGRCECKDGYSKYKFWLNCTDLDECSTGFNNCNLNTTYCNNTDGGYRCDCREGLFKLDDYSCNEFSISQDFSPKIGIIIGICMGILCIILVIFGIFCIRIRKRSNIIKRTKNVMNEPLTEEEINKISMLHLSRVSKVNSTKVRLDNIELVLKDRPKMTKEYESVPKQTDDSTKYGEQSKLKPKNRFKNVVPYDDNRVLLLSKKNLPFSEYVNASYIQDFNPKIKNIATQGPTIESIEDFWEMVIEQNISIIVMMTNCFENGKEKCSLYWPEKSSSTFGIYKIELIKSINWSQTIIRYLNIKIDNSYIKDVIQMHYIAWPDKQLPKNIPSLLLMRSLLRSHLKENELFAVHCSAGIGRTGAFLCLDYLMEEGKNEGSIDALASLQMLRRQRPLMIQTLDQYVMCYKAVYMNYIVKNTLINLREPMQLNKKLENFQNNTNNNEIITEFKVIENEMILVKKEKSTDCDSALIPLLCVHG